jgi:hypothetical protein
VTNELQGLLVSILHEIQSRKFRAFVISLLGLFLLWYQGSVDDNYAVVALVVATVGYIGGVAVEDGFQKLFLPPKK